jgi:hypothetical protein
MKSLTLPNDGYIVGSLTGDLFESLLEEGLRCENNKSVSTGLRTPDGVETCPHYGVSIENCKKLYEFLTPFITAHMEEFPYIKSIGLLSSDCPITFGEPWFNLQKPNNYLPMHMHDGVLSYSIWLQLPVSSEFIFSYATITGRMSDYRINLTPTDSGKFLLFPSTLNHAVHPFTSDDPNETRIVLSGNILFQGVAELINSNQINNFT